MKNRKLKVIEPKYSNNTPQAIAVREACDLVDHLDLWHGFNVIMKNQEITHQYGFDNIKDFLEFLFISHSYDIDWAGEHADSCQCADCEESYLYSRLSQQFKPSPPPTEPTFFKDLVKKNRAKESRFMEQIKGKRDPQI